jgi:Ca2+-binding EF-hand superfamily protein
MKTMHRLILVALPFGLAAALAAQPSPGNGPHGPRGPRGPGRHGPPIVRALDTNKDGVISADEIANAATSLKALDANGDGTVSVDELRPTPPPDAPADMPPPPADADGTRPHPMDPIMLALDANGDGALSATEIANAPTSLKALDLNKDGQLTLDEFRPLPSAGAGGPPSRH